LHEIETEKFVFEMCSANTKNNSLKKPQLLWRI